MKVLLHLLILQKSSRNVSKFLYLNLAITDLLHCTFPSTGTTLGLFYSRNLDFMSQEAIDILGWLLCTLPIISLYIICCIYAARMWAIHHSISYRYNFTLARAGCIMGVFWLLAATYSAIPFVCGTHYVYVKEVSMITFSVSRHYLKITEVQETVITFLTILVIDCPLLMVCICSVLSVWILQRNTLLPLVAGKV